MSGCTGINPTHDHNRKNVVVIDNDHLIAKAIFFYLQRKGYNVDIFHNASDALDSLSDHSPDAIIIDLNMQYCDNRLFAYLAEKNRKAACVPIIVLSIFETDRKTMEKVKPFAFIQKPFDMGYLLQTIESGLDHVEAVASV